MNGNKLGIHVLHAKCYICNKPGVASKQDSIVVEFNNFLGCLSSIACKIIPTTLSRDNVECSHSSSQDKFNTKFIIPCLTLSVPAKICLGANIQFQSHIPVPQSSLIIQSHVPVPHSSGESSPVFRDTLTSAAHYSTVY